MQIPPYIIPVGKFSVHMQQRRLRQGRHRLVKAVDDQIRAKLIPVLRKIRVESEMRTVRLIQDERDSDLMRLFCNGRHIRHDPVIRR